jgi:hypothetical protein
MDRALVAGCNRHQLRVLMAIFTTTTTYGRLEDDLYIAQLAAKVYGVERSVKRSQWDHTTCALAELAELGIITRRPIATHRRGEDGRATSPYYRIGVPPAGEETSAEELPPESEGVSFEDDRELPPEMEDEYRRKWRTSTAGNGPPTRESFPKSSPRESARVPARCGDELAALLTTPTDQYLDESYAIVGEFADEHGLDRLQRALDDFKAKGRKFTFPSKVEKALAMWNRRNPAGGADAGESPIERLATSCDECDPPGLHHTPAGYIQCPNRGRGAA